MHIENTLRVVISLNTANARARERYIRSPPAPRWALDLPALRTGVIYIFKCY